MAILLLFAQQFQRKYNAGVGEIRRGVPAGRPASEPVGAGSVLRYSSDDGASSYNYFRF